MLLFKIMLARWLCSPFIGKTLRYLFSDNIPAHGLTIDTHYVTDWTCASLFWGLYESAEARFVKSYLRADQPVVELGSSLGVISCLIRRRLSAKHQLICVEPNPHLIDGIQSNLKINGLNYNLSIKQTAIDYDKPQVSVILGCSNVDTKVSHDQFSDIVVPTITLSRLLKEMQIEGDYTLVADIEGAEAGIIYSDMPALQHCRQIIIEFHPTVHNQRSIQSDHLINKLISYGYTLCDRYGSVCVFERVQ
jgi:FkbM family methyltransferase